MTNDCETCIKKTAFAVRVVGTKSIKVVCSECGRTWKKIRFQKPTK